jgi:hypothetical protein
LASWIGHVCITHLKMTSYKTSLLSVCAALPNGLLRIPPAHPGYHGEMVWILVMLEQWLRAQGR